MEGILSIEVPLGFAAVIAVILGVVIALAFVFDLWSEVRELLGERQEWWSDRRD